MPLVLEKFPHIQHLTADGWMATKMSNDTRSRLNTFCTSLKSLTMRNVDIYRWDLVRLVLAYPQLRSLGMYVVSPKPDTGCSTFISPPDAVSQVDTLKLHNHQHSDAACVLFDAIELRIRRLELSFDGLRPLSSVPYILKQAGSSLQHFVCLSQNYSRDSTWDENITLTHNPHLSTLFIGNSILYRPQMTSGVAGIPPWLSLIQPLHVHLQQITISLDALQLLPPSAGAGKWTETDNHLARIARTRPHLQVRFQIYFVQVNEGLFQGVVYTIMTSLFKYLGNHGRLGIIVGSEWREDPEFGGGLVGNRHERWFNV